MSRIQQILSKAERDGTARRIGIDTEPGEPAPRAAAALAPPLRRPQPEPEVLAGEAAVDRIGAVTYAPPPVESAAAVEATLDPVLVAAVAPQSPAAERYRALRTRLAQSENGQARRVVLVTSPGKHDGKTVTALNLALTMAQEFQRRVVIVDADLRQPGVHTLLGLPPGPGLVDVLTGTATLEEALVEIPEHHLTVLRAGRAYERPAEMLGSTPMRRLIDALRNQFDRIVVDSAPAVVSDPNAVAPLTDGMLLVVRASATTKPDIARAIAALGASNVVGMVLNESAAPLSEQYGATA
jgi:capsular exopolysaccharide synthesis family protein